MPLEEDYKNLQLLKFVSETTIMKFLSRLVSVNEVDVKEHSAKVANLKNPYSYFIPLNEYEVQQNKESINWLKDSKFPLSKMIKILNLGDPKNIEEYSEHIYKILTILLNTELEPNDRLVLDNKLNSLFQKFECFAQQAHPIHSKTFLILDRNFCVAIGLIKKIRDVEASAKITRFLTEVFLKLNYWEVFNLLDWHPSMLPFMKMVKIDAKKLHQQYVEDYNDSFNKNVQTFKDNATLIEHLPDGRSSSFSSLQRPNISRADLSEYGSANVPEPLTVPEDGHFPRKRFMSDSDSAKTDLQEFRSKKTRDGFEEEVFGSSSNSPSRVGRTRSPSNYHSPSLGSSPDDSDSSKKVRSIVFNSDGTPKYKDSKRKHSKHNYPQRAAPKIDNYSADTQHECQLTHPDNNRPCLRRFSRKYELIRHQETVHSSTKKIYRCLLCLKENLLPRVFTRHDTLAKHIRVNHHATAEEAKHAIAIAKKNVKIIPVETKIEGDVDSIRTISRNESSPLT